MSPDELSCWLDNLTTPEIVYGRGASTQGFLATAKRARELAAAGRVKLHIRRNKATGVLEYVAIRHNGKPQPTNTGRYILSPMAEMMRRERISAGRRRELAS